MSHFFVRIAIDKSSMMLLHNFALDCFVCFPGWSAPARDENGASARRHSLGRRCLTRCEITLTFSKTVCSRSRARSFHSQFCVLFFRIVCSLLKTRTTVKPGTRTKHGLRGLSQNQTLSPLLVWICGEGYVCIRLSRQQCFANEKASLNLCFPRFHLFNGLKCFPTFLDDVLELEKWPFWVIFWKITFLNDALPLVTPLLQLLCILFLNVRSLLKKKKT